MLQIELSHRFRKQLRTLSQASRIKLGRKLRIFSKNPFQSALKTHPLKGALQGIYAFKIAADLRVTFIWQDRAHSKVLLLQVGGHGRLYR